MDFDRDFLRREGGRKNAKRRTDFTYADPFEAATPGSFELTRHERVVACSPSRVAMGTVAVGASARSVLGLTNLSSDSVRIMARLPLRASDVGGNRMACEWEPKRLAPGLKGRCTVTLHARSVGSVECTLQVRAEGDVICVPLTFDVRARTAADDEAAALAAAPPLVGVAATLATLDDALKRFEGDAAAAGAKSADGVAVFASDLSRVPQIPNTVWDWSAGPDGKGGLVVAGGGLLVRPKIDPDAVLADVIAAADAEQAAIDARLDVWWAQQRQLAGWSGGAEEETKKESGGEAGTEAEEEEGAAPETPDVVEHYASIE